MKCIPLHTKKFRPPQDDIYAELKQVLEGAIQEGDVLAVTSKIVSIHEGRSIPVSEVEDKEKLVREESDAYCKGDVWNLSVKHHALLLSAGIDESNADEHYLLLPQRPQESAWNIRSFVQKNFGIKNIGVVVTDSHSIPFRYGTLGVSIGFAGFKPVKFFSGERDLFGRTFNYTRINVADSLAGMAVYMMGETTEQTPLCILRDSPHVEFTDKRCEDELLIPPKEDIYYELLRPLYE